MQDKQTGKQGIEDKSQSPDVSKDKINYKPPVTVEEKAVVDTEKDVKESLKAPVPDNSSREQLDLKEIYLPSRGVHYNNRVPGGVIYGKEITTVDEKILFTSQGDYLQRMLKILERLLIFPKAENPEHPEKTLPPLKPIEMLSTDFFYAFIMLRVHTYEPDFSFKLKCKNCGFDFQHTVSLYPHIEKDNEEEAEVNPELKRALTVTYSKSDDTEPFEMVMPRTGHQIQFRLQRISDEMATAAFVDKVAKQKGLADGNPGYTYRWARIITAVDGDTSYDCSKPSERGEKPPIRKTLDFVESLPGPDLAALQKALNAVDSGLDIRIPATCGRCGNTDEYMVPFQEVAEFFRPDSE